MLTKTEVNVEEGSIISDDDIQRWCFSTTERFDKTTFFGTRMPEEMEEWLEAFEQVIEEREKLVRNLSHIFSLINQLFFH